MECSAYSLFRHYKPSILLSSGKVGHLVIVILEYCKTGFLHTCIIFCILHDGKIHEDYPHYSPFLIFILKKLELSITRYELTKLLHVCEKLIFYIFYILRTSSNLENVQNVIVHLVNS